MNIVELDRIAEEMDLEKLTKTVKALGEIRENFPEITKTFYQLEALEFLLGITERTRLIDARRRQLTFDAEA